MTKAIELARAIVTFWADGVLEREDAEECAAELRRLAAVEQELAAIRALEPVAWLVVNGESEPEFAAGWEGLAHEHINDACDHEVEGAGKWRVIPVVALPEQKK